MRNKAFLLSPFFLSISLGAICWFFVFLIFPIVPVYTISYEAFLYILLSYLSLILGYIVVPRSSESQKIKTTETSIIMLIFLVIIVVISFIIRYYDLFVLRGVSFYNTFSDNRILIANKPKGLIYVIASVVRYMFFIPLILFFYSKFKSKILLLFCVILFLLPFLEGMIRGTRNSFFYPSILMILTLLYFKKVKFKKTHIGMITSIGIVLFIIATSILKNREIDKEEDYKYLTSNAIYNKFLKPKESVIIKIHEIENNTVKGFLISGLQTGQYYNHGVFEFDNLIKEYNKDETYKFQYGKYNFLNYVKFLEIYNITNTDLESIQRSNPRVYTFITFFGGLYIDFGWFGLVIMFLFGVFQKILFNKVKKNKPHYLPLFIFFIFINFFMLTFNFFRNAGVSILTINIVFIICVSTYNRFSPIAKE
jgi:hypothetical protein